MNIQVTNLSQNTIDSDLRKLFSAYGEVMSAIILKDKVTGRSRCSALIDMVNEGQASKAIGGLHLTMLNGKKINVSQVVYDPATYRS